MSRALELLETLKQWLEMPPEAVKALHELPDPLRTEAIDFLANVALDVLHSDVGELLAAQGASNQSVLRAFGGRFIDGVSVRGDVAAFHMSRSDSGGLRVERIMFKVSDNRR